MPQFSRPIADVSAGSWTTDTGASTNLYQTLDESSFSDADYVQSSTTSDPDELIISMRPFADPAVNTGHVVRLREWKDSASGDVRDLDVIVEAGPDHWPVHTEALDAIDQTANAITITLTSDEVDEFRAHSGYAPGEGRVRLVARKRRTITTSLGVTYTTSPSTLVCDIRRPSTGGPYPVVLMLVDGFFQDNDFTHAEDEAIRFAQEESFATIILELRTAPTNIAPAPMDDCADAIDFIVANAATYNLDPNKIAAIGGSGGGYLAIYMALGTHLSAPQFARVLCAASMSSPNAFRFMDDDGASGPFTEAIEDFLGVTEAASPSTWDTHSPINDVTAGAKPIFQAYSTAESMPVNQGTRLKTPLDSAGIDNRMLTYSGTLHGWDLINSGQPWAEMVTWLHRYLG